jgi:hypothetical protein
MKGKTAWRMSAKALEASVHEHCPPRVRAVLFQFGVACFWIALATEGRARLAWQEVQAHNGLAGPLGFAGVWAHCSEDLREALLRRSGDALPMVPAWSLPDNRKMRGLGLGYIWAVLCPYCSEFHVHSPGEGRRHAHCSAHKDDSHYLLEFAGALPDEHHVRFYAWVRGNLPRLVHPEAANDAGHSVSAAEPLAA